MEHYIIYICESIVNFMYIRKRKKNDFETRELILGFSLYEIERWRMELIMTTSSNRDQAIYSEQV